MRKIIVALLALYGGWRRFRLRLVGRTEADEAARRITSGEAWAEYYANANANANAPLLTR